LDYAAQVANGLLVPTDFPSTHGDLARERFYVQLGIVLGTKVADFQNLRRVAYGDYMR
jgi:hypothetical protein